MSPVSVPGKLARPLLSGLTALMLLAPHLSALAQEPVGAMDRRPPSPTAASLGKFGEMPVSLFSGTPDVSVPLTTVQGATLELPITLRYHASGIRVADIPSWVGTGWSLDAGGVITRVVRGLPDDAPHGYLETGHLINDTIWEQVGQPGTMYAGSWSDSLTVYLQQVNDRLVDPEPDLFYYNVMGYSGQFAIAGDGTIITSPRSALRIDYVDPVPIPDHVPTMPNAINDRSIPLWTITAPDGTKFTFGQDYGTEYSIRTLSQSAGAGYSHCERNCTWASAWYLTQIETPSGEVIMLEYEPPTEASGDYTIQPSQRFQIEYLYFISSRYGCASSETGMLQPAWSYDSTYVGTPRLTQITGNGHWVTFNSEQRGQEYFAPGEYRLDSIEEWSMSDDYQEVRIRTHQLEYFAPGEVVAFGNRLALKQIQEIGSDSLAQPPYRFDYVTEPWSLPPDPLSFSVDHWGYFNGKANFTGLPQVSYMTAWTSGTVDVPGDDRSPQEAMMAGSLRELHYPTGGSTVLIMEPHAYTRTQLVTQGTYQADISTAQMVDDDSTAVQPFQIAAGQAAQVQLAVAFIPALQPSPPDPGEPPPAIQIPDCPGPCARVRILSGSDVIESVVMSFENMYLEKTLFLPVGEYALEVSVSKYYGYPADPIMRPGEYLAGGLVSIVAPEPAQMLAGGLRVARIEDYASDESLAAAREYHYPGGYLKNEPVYLYKGHDGNIQGMSGVSCTWAYRQSTPVYPLGSLSGSAVVYGGVEVRRLNADGVSVDGSSYHVFDIPLIESYDHSNALWAFAATTSYDYLFGFESESITKDHNERIVSMSHRKQGREGEEEAIYARAIAARMLHRQIYNVHGFPIYKRAYHHFQRYKVMGEWVFVESEKQLMLGED